MLCSHDNLFVAINEPTPFCQIQGDIEIYRYHKLCTSYIHIGFLLQATSIIYTSLWLLFVFHMFAKIVDTNESWIVNNQHHTGKIHVIEVGTVLCLGFITPTITLTALDGYSISDFPPVWCFSTTDIFFYGVILPSLIISVIGLSLILITILYIHRVSTYVLSSLLCTYIIQHNIHSKCTHKSLATV